MDYLSQEITNLTIDQNKSVGSIEGTFDVSSTGGANYTVPIEVPPGTMGMQPSISIVYSSQAGTGELGHGWSLGGLSSISRTKNSDKCDGGTFEIKLSYQDKFSLNGQSMILKSGNYGYPNSEYTLQTDDFSTITANGTAGNGPDEFIVKTSDGKKYYYGQGNSKLFPHGSSTPLVWRISKIEDAHRNYMTFTYGSLNGESWLERIDYTANDNSSPVISSYNFVTFEYKLKEDIESSYIESFPLVNSRILTAIKTWSDNSLVKEYNFKYFKNFNSLFLTEMPPLVIFGIPITLPILPGFKTCLNTISEKGWNGDELNPTLINWSEHKDDKRMVKTTHTKETSNCSEDINFKVTGDFNGDGKSDWLEVVQFECDIFPVPKYFLYLSKEDDEFRLVKNYNEIYAMLGLSISVNSAIIENIVPGDFDSDGDDDLMIVYMPNGSSSSYVKFFKYQEDTMSTIIYRHFTDLVKPYLPSTLTGAMIDLIPGDFDGDGFNDYLVVNKSGLLFGLPLGVISKNTNLSTFSNVIANDINNYFFGSFMQGYHVKYYPTDLDNDGKTEIIVFIDNSNTNQLLYYEILYYDKINNTTYSKPISLTYNLSDFKNNFPFLIGDYNGDAKSDILTFESQSNSWNMYVSNGENFTSPIAIPSLSIQNLYSIDCGSILKPEDCYVGDYNGDGKDDLAIHKLDINIANQSLNTNQSYLNVYYSKGTDFFLEAISYPLSVINNGTEDECDYGVIPRFILGDFNGDAKTDIIIPKSESSTFYLFKFRPEEKINLVNKITNGYNATVSIEYKTLSYKENSTNIYRKRKIGSYPSMYIQAPIHVAHAITNSNGVGGFTTSRYYYQNLLVNRQEGLVGFEGRLILNESTNFGNLVELKFDPVYFNIIESKTTEGKFTGNLDFVSSLIKKREEKTKFKNIIINSSLCDQIMNLQVEIISIDYLNNSSSKTVFEYYPHSSSYYNLLKSQKTEIYNSVSATTKISEYDKTILSYGFDGNQKLPLTIITSSKYLLNFPAKTLEEVQEITYAANGKIDHVNINDGVPGRISKSISYGYFTFGAIMETVESVSDESYVHKKTFEYDQLGRFIIKERNYYNTSSYLEKNYQYNNRSGKLNYIIDENGKRTDFYYDGFFKPKTTVYPNQKTLIVNYEWALNSGITNALYVISSTSENSPHKKEYYDLLGRLIKSETQSMSGTINLDYFYNIKGLIYKKSQPYFLSGSPKYKYFYFDENLRTTSESDDCGNQTSIDYSVPKKVTYSAPDGKVTSKTYNELGDIVLSQDNGGTIQYFYEAKGRLIKTITNGYQIVTEYDSEGNKSKEIDLNHGTKLYTYNGFGELKRQQDNEGNKIEFLYDGFSRVTEKKIIPCSLNPNAFSTETITYSFRTATPAIGKLETEVSSTGNWKGYAYNGNDRLIEIDDRISHSGVNRLLITRYGYDIYGNQETVTYPSGYSVKNIYNSLGDLIKVVNNNNNSVIYTLESKDALGRITREKFGQDCNGGIIDPNLLPPGSVFGSNSLYSINNFDECGNSLERNLELQTTNYQVIGSNSAPNPYSASLNLIHNFLYTFDNKNGNLLGRKDVVKNLYETFEYDNVDRLTKIIGQYGNTKMKMEYISNGNIDTKSDLGKYRYRVTQTPPHAVEFIVSDCYAGPVIEHDICDAPQIIKYTPTRKTYTIEENDLLLKFNYGTNNERNYHSLSSGGTGSWTVEREKYYSGLYENIITTNLTSVENLEYNYVTGPSGTFGVMIRDFNHVLPDKFYYIQKDHLGSFIALVDECGNIVQELSYNAWGRRRNPYTWGERFITHKPEEVDPTNGQWNPSLYDGSTRQWPSAEDQICSPNYQLTIDRGYTGNEHHDEFWLINLNARMYDPVLGRMLGPDDYISNPTNSQNYNRYSYALNNPLKYTDPDGNNPVLVFLAFELFDFGMRASQSGFNFKMFDWKGYFLSFGLNAVGSIASYGVGQCFGSVTANSMVEAGRALAHGLTQGVISTISGGDFLSAFGAGLFSSFTGSALHGSNLDNVQQIGVSALSGGIIAELQGGDFYQGTTIGLSVSAFNHLVEHIKINNPRFDGKFFHKYEKMKSFMTVRSGEEGLEISSFEILDRDVDKTRYYVLPWFNNTETKSDNSHPIPGYDPFCDKIIQQFHTHLTENPIYITSGVSSGDIEFSYKNKMPVNAIYSNNKVYTFYWHAPYSQTWSSDAFPDGKGGYGFLNTKY